MWIKNEPKSLWGNWLRIVNVSTILTEAVNTRQEHCVPRYHCVSSSDTEKFGGEVAFLLNNRHGFINMVKDLVISFLQRRIRRIKFPEQHHIFFPSLQNHVPAVKPKKIHEFMQRVHIFFLFSGQHCNLVLDVRRRRRRERERSCFSHLPATNSRVSNQLLKSSFHFGLFISLPEVQVPSITDILFQKILLAWQESIDLKKIMCLYRTSQKIISHALYIFQFSACK